MSRSRRSDLFDPLQVSVFHCINRCVRHCHLCGNDPLTGKNFEHRKQWIEERIAFLACYFGIEVLSYAILSNHLHLVLRNRPDVVASWSDTDVARRWLYLCPLRKDDQGVAQEPTEAELDTIRNDPQRLAKIRKRLSHISWMMGMIAERIARLSNAEEERTGRFWEGRYRGIKLCDDAAVLACMAYVDLNPIRAGLACSPETSNFTSVQRRIRELEKYTRTVPLRSAEQCQGLAAPTAGGKPTGAAESPGAIEPIEAEQAEVAHQPEEHVAADSAVARSPLSSEWLAPLGEGNHQPGPQANRSGRRCSEKTALAIRLEDYLELLEWTGRQVRAGKRGAIPEHLSPILERLGIGGREQWLCAAMNFETIFSRVAGRPETIERERTRRTQRPFRPAKKNVFTREAAAANS